MEIICDSCQRKLKIPDDKIPKDRVAYLNCPGCRKRLTFRLNSQTEDQEKIKSCSLNLDDLVSDTYDSADKPFDYLEEAAETSLVCVSDREDEEKIKAILTELKYHATVAENARDALKKMRYHTFDLVILDEIFECEHYLSNGILIYLQNIPMHMRRNTFIILLTDQFRTMDNMEAFHRSVNLIVNKADSSNLKKIMLRGIADHDAFYKVFKNTAKKIHGN